MKRNHDTPIDLVRLPQFRQKKNPAFYTNTETDMIKHSEGKKNSGIRYGVLEGTAGGLWVDEKHWHL